jgi:hypothetical protein
VSFFQLKDMTGESEEKCPADLKMSNVQALSPYEKGWRQPFGLILRWTNLHAFCGWKLLQTQQCWRRAQQVPASAARREIRWLSLTRSMGSLKPGWAGAIYRFG